MERRDKLKYISKSAAQTCFKQNTCNNYKEILATATNADNENDQNELQYSYNNYSENGKDSKNSGQIRLRHIIKQLIDDYKPFKYTVYRCAAKIVALQKILHTHNIPYRLVLAVMERHNVHNSDQHLMVPPFQLTSLFYDIYHVCETLGHFHHSIDMAVKNLADFFWDVYDPQRRYSISIIEIKLILILLCKSFTSHQLDREIYKIIVASSKNQRITKLILQSILNILVKLFAYLDEENAYGQHNINPIIEQCFAKYNGIIDITEQQFQSLWYSSQTLFSIYGNLLALVKRMEDTQILIHNNSCAGCHCSKIIGMRFRCQICKDYSLCLNCFATDVAGNSNRNTNSNSNSGYRKHPLNHKFYEIYNEDVLHNKSMMSFIKKFCLNSFCLRKCLNCNDTEDNDDSQEIIQVKDSLNPNETETELVTITISPSFMNSSTCISPTTTSNNNIYVNSKVVAKDSHSLLKSSNDDVRAPYTVKTRPESDVHLTGLATTACNALNVSERLQIIIDKLLLQNGKLEQQLKRVQCSTSTPEEIAEFLVEHQKFLLHIIKEMRSFSNCQSYPVASTPQRFMISQKPGETGNFSVAIKNDLVEKSNQDVPSFNNNKERLSLSIYGTEINRSYLDANKSDYSLNDLSVWFNHQSLPSMAKRSNSDSTSNKMLSVVPEMPLTTQTTLASFLTKNTVTDMTNFKLLLDKVKEIVEDSYSDNTELSEATQNLENVVDAIIKTEESLRRL